MIFNMTGGGKEIQGSATPEKVLYGETFMSAESEDVQEGTMPNIGAVAVSLNAGESYTPPTGYHNGLGVVAANSLEGQTAANAAAAQILTGYNAWVNGRLVEGSMANNGAVSQALNAGGSYTVPAGYHNGSGRVTANSLASQTAGTATAADIAKGKTAWVGGDQLTGTKVPQGTATPSDVVSGKTFQSAASEGLQTGTRSGGTYYVRTGSLSYDSGNPVQTVNLGFYPAYLYMYRKRTDVSNGSDTPFTVYWNGTWAYTASQNFDTVTKTSSGFTVNVPSYNSPLYYVAAGQ